MSIFECHFRHGVGYCKGSRLGTHSLFINLLFLQSRLYILIFYRFQAENSKTIAYDISVFEYIPAVSLWRLRNFEASLQAFKLDMTNITSFTNVFSIEQHAASVLVGFGKFCRLERGFVKNL